MKLVLLIGAGLLIGTSTIAAEVLFLGDYEAVAAALKEFGEAQRDEQK